jgi:hypothetical protein
MLGRGETFKRSDTLKGTGMGKEAKNEEASKPSEGGGGEGRKEEEAKFEGGFAQYYEYIQKKGNNTFLPKFHMLFRFEANLAFFFKLIFFIVSSGCQRKPMPTGNLPSVRIIFSSFKIPYFPREFPQLNTNST